MSKYSPSKLKASGRQARRDGFSRDDYPFKVGAFGFESNVENWQRGWDLEDVLYSMDSAANANPSEKSIEEKYVDVVTMLNKICSSDCFDGLNGPEGWRALLEESFETLEKMGVDTKSLLKEWPR